ncbi:MAG: chemotaxis protein CheW [Proteobacteria bacterium]|nr:MAG: chemotaxis protein CheW [Pseudomonadota bacterium]
MSAPVSAPARSGFDLLARAAAGRGEGADESAAEAELLVLWLGDDAYALPVERVREIVRLRPITPVPRVPACVRGVLSLRGEIVQVVDLRLRLGLAPAQGASPRRRVIVLNGEDGQLTGVLVDRVSEVLRLREDALRPPTERDAGTVAALAPYGERFVSVFDVDRLLDVAGE